MNNKIIYFSCLFYFVMASIAGCSAERSIVKPSGLGEQTIHRLKSKDITSIPIVFSQVSLLEKGIVYPVSAAIITLDDVVLSANERGEYNMTMNPGVHRIMVGQIGMHQSRVTLKVVQGDSIRIDFQLRPDLRPL